MQSSPYLKLVRLLASGLLITMAGMAQEPDSYLRQSLSATWAYSDNPDGTNGTRQGMSVYSLGYRLERIFRDADRTELDLFIAPVASWRSGETGGEGGVGSSRASLLGAFGFTLRHAVTPRISLRAADTLSSSDLLGSGQNSPVVAATPPTTPPDTTTPTATQRGSPIMLVNDASLGSSIALTPEESLDLMLGQTTTRYYGDTQAGDNVGSDIWRGSATLGEMLDPARRLSFTLSAQSSQQQQPQSTTNAMDTGATVISATVGLDNTFDQDLIAHIQGGVQNTWQDGRDEPSRGLTGDASLLIGATTPTRYRLGVSYGTQASSLAGYAVSKTLSGNVGVDHDVLPGVLLVGVQGRGFISRYSGGAATSDGSDRTLSLGLNSTYRQRLTLGLQASVLKRETGASATLPESSERTTTLGVNSSYLITPAWTISGSVSRDDSQSDSAQRPSYQRNRMSLSLSTTF